MLTGISFSRQSLTDKITACAFRAAVSLIKRDNLVAVHFSLLRNEILRWHEKLQNDADFLELAGHALKDRRSQADSYMMAVARKVWSVSLRADECSTSSS